MNDEGWAATDKLSNDFRMLLHHVQMSDVQEVPHRPHCGSKGLNLTFFNAKGNNSCDLNNLSCLFFSFEVIAAAVELTADVTANMFDWTNQGWS